MLGIEVSWNINPPMARIFPGLVNQYYMLDSTSAQPKGYA